MSMAYDAKLKMDFCTCKLERGMYGLPQARILANQLQHPQIV